MRNINVTINTRNAFVRESLVAMVNDLTRGDLRARFSWRNTDLSAEDIIICEVIPGEIYLCNTLIKNRKRGSSLIILHSYDQLPEDEFMINCLKGVIFVSLKAPALYDPHGYRRRRPGTQLRQLSASRVIAIADRRSARYSRRAGYE